MKKALVTGALITGAMFGALIAGSAMAADMSAKPAPMLMKAPPMPAYNWTGCYIGAGGGYGTWNQDQFEKNPAGLPISSTVTSGGRGWFGTAGAGCDYQVNSNIVIGAYGDWDFGNIKGQMELADTPALGTESEKWAWAGAGRIGWLVTPTVLTFFSAGYTQAHFDGIGFAGAGIVPGPVGSIADAHTYNGWFLGSGFDYAVSILPAGFFLRSEYRYATYQAADLPILIASSGVPTGFSFNSKKYVQTVRSELVWRFNWY
jgi:outer membrane immunogenic protein